MMSHCGVMCSFHMVLFNSTVKKVNNPTPINCQQFLLTMKLSCSEVEAIEAVICQQSASELWQECVTVG